MLKDEFQKKDMGSSHKLAYKEPEATIYRCDDRTKKFSFLQGLLTGAPKPKVTCTLKEAAAQNDNWLERGS